MINHEPERSYDPDNSCLGAKIARHLRKAGWIKTMCRGKVRWVHKKSGTLCSFANAIRHQLHKEGWEE